MVKCPHGQNVTAGVLQGYNICPLLFLIYVNDISRIFYQSKLFTDDTSLFSVIHDSQSSANDFIKDAEMIHKWAVQWKLNFNQDPTKQAQEIIFSRKTKNCIILS